MIEPIAQKKGRGAREKALLVGLAVYPTTRRVAEEHLEELALLADTAGADVVDTYLQSLPRPDGTWYIGKGKAEEIAEAIEEISFKPGF